MYTALLRGHCCNWMSDYCQIACVHVCVSLCVCRGGGTFLCQREGCCNSRVKAREINTQKSYREYQTEKWACSLFVISELNVDLVIFICCLASNHPLLISPPLLYMLHRFIFPSFSISSFPSSRILLFYLSSHFSTRPAYHPAIPYPVSSFEVFAIYPLLSGPLPILSSHHPAEAIGISLID